MQRGRCGCVKPRTLWENPVNSHSLVAMPGHSMSDIEFAIRNAGTIILVQARDLSLLWCFYSPSPCLPNCTEIVWSPFTMDVQLGRDPWKVLGLERTADKSEIRAAYKKLALKCHPDRGPYPGLKVKKQGQFEQVQRAYTILNDDSEREKWEGMELRMQARAQARARARAHADSNPGSGSRLRHYGSENLDRRRRRSSSSSSDGGGGTIYYRVSDDNTRETHPYQVPRERRWERERERPRETERDRERQDFLKFALQLFDEVSLDSCYDSVCDLTPCRPELAGYLCLSRLIPTGLVKAIPPVTIW